MDYSDVSEAIGVAPCCCCAMEGNQNSSEDFFIYPLRHGLPTAVDGLGFYVTVRSGMQAYPPLDSSEGTPPCQFPSAEELADEALWVNYILQYARLSLMLQQVAGANASPLATVTAHTPNQGGMSTPQRTYAMQLPLYPETLQRARRRVVVAMRRRLRAHGGIPFSPLRRLVWAFFSGSMQRPSLVRCAHHALYLQLIATPPPTETIEAVRRDLDRTFPAHCVFRGSTSVGQTELRRILHAYSRYDAAVGYCQGMAFIVSVLLLHHPEEEAFWIFVHLMRGARFRMRELYLPGFPLLQHFFSVLRRHLRRFLPLLHQHFEEEGVDVAFFASQWLMTLFSYQFPIDLVSRLWDLFLSEGWSIMFRATLALLQWDQTHLLTLGMEHTLLFLKESHALKSSDEFIRRLYAVPLCEKDIPLEQSGKGTNEDNTIPASAETERKCHAEMILVGRTVEQGK